MYDTVERRGTCHATKMTRLGLGSASRPSNSGPAPEFGNPIHRRSSLRYICRLNYNKAHYPPARPRQLVLSHFRRRISVRYSQAVFSPEFAPLHPSPHRPHILTLATNHCSSRVASDSNECLVRTYTQAFSIGDSQTL